MEKGTQTVGQRINDCILSIANPNRTHNCRIHARLWIPNAVTCTDKHVYKLFNQVINADCNQSFRWAILSRQRSPISEAVGGDLRSREATLVILAYKLLLVLVA